MKRQFTAGCCAMTPLAIATITLLAWPAPTLASEDCGVSFMILPSGTCIEMSYLSLLVANRENMAQVEHLYQQQLRANAELDRYSREIGETSEERTDRYLDLLETKDFRDEVAIQTRSREAFYILSTTR